MNVYIHFQFLDNGWGGSNSFLSTLARYFASQRDVTLRSSIRQPADIFLMTSWSTGKRLTSVPVVDRLRRRGTPGLFSSLFGQKKRPPKIIHRLDGIGYLYGRPDRAADERQAQLNRLSDHSIVQSRYSLELFKREKFDLTPSTVIPNGVDSSVFHCRDRSWWTGDRPLVFGAVSWSDNPRKGHKILAEFSKLSGIRVVFKGRWPQGLDPVNVELQEAGPSASLGGFYRSCDAFLFPARDEACPNALLEAISSGLPCLYHPSGGTPEVAERYGIALDENDLQQSLESLKASYDRLVETIQANAEDQFSIRHVGRRYLDLFASLLG